MAKSQEIKIQLDEYNSLIRSREMLKIIEIHYPDIMQVARIEWDEWERQFENIL